MQKFLIIQTAFIGDVVLATAVAEKLHTFYPEAKIDFLLRRGNEALLKNHPFINRLYIWDKRKSKRRNLIKIALEIRTQRYSHVINLHRFGTSGFITFLSGAKFKAGFDKNPFSFCYTHTVKHFISEPYSENPIHETDRNQMLVEPLTDARTALPRLYPNNEDFEKTADLKNQPYICIAPSSVWFTKQYPKEKWAALIQKIPEDFFIYLIGGPGDKGFADEMIAAAKRKSILNLSGQLSFLESAALMKDAEMNYVNDSGPLHFASAVNAPVTAVFCSTVPAFGFGPLQENGKVVEIDYRLYCRPCGLHGKKACPERHFRCAMELKNEQLLWWISKKT